MKIYKGTGAGLEVIGRLKEIPTIRTTKQGQTVCTLILAVDGKYKNEHGDFEDDTQWLSITLWGKAVSRLQEYSVPGIRIRVQAIVKMDSQHVMGPDDKKYHFTIPQFSSNNFEFMDGVHKNEKQNEHTINESN